MTHSHHANRNGQYASADNGAVGNGHFVHLFFTKGRHDARGESSKAQEV